MDKVSLIKSWKWQRVNSKLEGRSLRQQLCSYFLAPFHLAAAYLLGWTASGYFCRKLLPYIDFLGDWASSHFVSPQFNENQCHTSISDWNLFPIAIDSQRWFTKKLLLPIRDHPIVCPVPATTMTMNAIWPAIQLEIRLENSKKNIYHTSTSAIKLAPSLLIPNVQLQFVQLYKL